MTSPPGQDPTREALIEALLQIRRMAGAVDLGGASVGQLIALCRDASREALQAVLRNHGQGETEEGKLPMLRRPTDEYFTLSVIDELKRARFKFPSAVLSMAALTEEVGELAQALLKWRAGEQSWDAVVGEAIQVAAMAQRVAVEGDASFEAVAYSEPGKSHVPA